MRTSFFLIKIFALLLFVSITTKALEAQGWYKSYSDIYPQEEMVDDYFRLITQPFKGMIETDDQGFLFWGTSGYSDSDYYYFLSDFDSPYFPEPVYQEEYLPMDIILTKMDLAGNVQWTQTYTDGSTPAFTNLGNLNMIPSPDGNGYMAFGKTRNLETSVFRGIHLDESGNVLNSFDLSEEDIVGTTIGNSIFNVTEASTTDVFKIIPAPDNTFLVLGSNFSNYINPDPAENMSWVSKIDMVGNVVWGTILNNQISAVEAGTSSNPNDSLTVTLNMYGLAVYPSGEIVTSGVSAWGEYNQKFLFKLDADGNQLWSQNIQGSNQNKYVDLLIHPNGDIFTQNHEYIFSWKTIMNRLSANGDTIWADTSYSNILQEDFARVDFCLLPDGNIGLLELQTGYSVIRDHRFSIIDVDNNYISTGNTFPLALETIVDFENGKIPHDRTMIATSDNSMLIAGVFKQYQGQVFPFTIKSGPNGSIPFTRFSGQVFVDENNNCIYDSGEIGIPNTTIFTGLINAITDENGYYQMDLANGNDYTITTSFGTGYPEDLWGTNCPDSIELSVDADLTDTLGVDFGFYPLTYCPRLTVNLHVPFLGTGFSNAAAIKYANIGTLAADSVRVLVTMDNTYSLDPDETSMPFTYDPVSETYEFFIGTLDIFETGEIELGILVPEDAVVGSTPCFEATILPFDLCDQASPDWDGSQLAVDGFCEGDSIRFTIKNIGQGDMTINRNYALYSDDLLIQFDDVQLDAGDSSVVKKFADGHTFRMQAEQSPNFPGPSSPSAVIELCNATTNPSTLGFVTTMDLDDGVYYIDIECRVVTEGFSLNDKMVMPSGVGEQHYVRSDTPLEYTIRFQNTGTSTVSNAFVLDTLSELLDINSFQPGPATHEYELSILPGRVIRWDFPNISLPNSSTDLVGSNGALKFTISAITSIPQPSEIHNKAAIFFDFNTPIITEDMFVTVCDECLIQTMVNDGVYFDGKVLLEGAYQEAGLMTNNLQDLIPMNQPFANFPYLYDGNEQLSQVPPNMVDWVLVEARSGTPATNGNRATTTVETQAAILLNDGSIRGLDGISGVRFVNLTADEPYHFCIRHRNHLDVLTATAMFPTENMVYDFTTGTSQALGAAQLKWFGADAKAVMYSGDFNSDGVIQTTDYDMWAIQPAAVEVYDMPDANLDGVIQVSDYDKWFFNKAKVGNVEIGF